MLINIYISQIIFDLMCMKSLGCYTLRPRSLFIEWDVPIYIYVIEHPVNHNIFLNFPK